MCRLYGINCSNPIDLVVNHFIFLFLWIPHLTVDTIFPIYSLLNHLLNCVLSCVSVSTTVRHVIQQLWLEIPGYVICPDCHLDFVRVPAASLSIQSVHTFLSFLYELHVLLHGVVYPLHLRHGHKKLISHKGSNFWSSSSKHS